MANLTIVVDDETLKRARMRALEEGASVNQFLAEQLRGYAGVVDERARRRRAAEAFVALSRELEGSSQGRTWTRDDLYEERLGSGE